MNRSQPATLGLFVLAVHLCLSQLEAKDFPGNYSTNLPPFPRSPSPVQFFRNLLAMTPEQRESYFTNKPAGIRTRLEAKVREYELLDPSERELRLRATELRWYLMPLLRADQTNREAVLALVPDDLRDLVKARLNQWIILPPMLQQEFLDNERALRYFSRIDVTNNLAPGDYRHQPTDEEQARWNSLSNTERARMTAEFDRFFGLTAPEMKKTLGTLSPAERQQMEKTLADFDRLPPPQRQQCIRGFTKFAQMSPQDRTQFLKNAERWSQMSSADRKAWHDLVANVPQWPPLPPTAIMPPPPRLRALPAVATNQQLGEKHF